MTPKCYSCMHRRDIPGDAHSECAHPRRGSIHVSGAPQGIRGGWFRWPLNFDPTWLLTCDGYEAEASAHTEKATPNLGTVPRTDGTNGGQE